MPLLLQDEARKAQQIAEGTAARLHERGIDVASLVDYGPPAPQILALTQTLAPDLVVLGAHGQAALIALQIGSVALNVARLAPCSALVVRGSPSWGGRLLLAVDGSPESEKATHLLASLPLPQVKECTVLHVLEPMSLGNSSGEGVSSQEAACRIVDEAAAVLTAAGIEATPRLEKGHAAQEILRIAEGGKIDLIVVGARGARGLPQFDLGSVSARVLHYASCSVLIAR
jgi:nucleotide-binding universal stress UspA family protein